MTETTVVAEGLFTWPAEEPRLIGSECSACGLLAFPAAVQCLRCFATHMQERLLSPRGTLWTFTTQGFRPPSPPYDGNDAADFRPYALGYVLLPEGILVEGRLTEADPANLRIGQPMRLVVIPYTHGGEGSSILTFAFAPDTGEQR